jgi:hypothetical protein
MAMIPFVQMRFIIISILWTDRGYLSQTDRTSDRIQDGDSRVKDIQIQV